MISRAAIEAVTDPANSSSSEELGEMRVLRSEDVVAELRRIEGVGEQQARRLGRDAVAHLGGHVEPRVYRADGTGRMRRHYVEIWSVPSRAIRPD